MLTVYILRSRVNGSLYKGLCQNLKLRIKEHNAGENKSTKAKRPWEVVYVETYNSRPEARMREKFFKSGEGRELIKRLINK